MPGQGDQRRRITAAPAARGLLDRGHVGGQRPGRPEQPAQSGRAAGLGGEPIVIRLQEAGISGDAVATDAGLLVDQGALQPVRLSLGRQDGIDQRVGYGPASRQLLRDDQGRSQRQQRDHREDEAEPALHRQDPQAEPMIGRASRRHCATLTGATLTGATLTGATLTGATLTGATLTGATLTGATLTGAT